MNVEEVLDEWRKDSRIDKSVLTECSLRIPSLHQKYKKIWIEAKKALREEEGALKRLRLAKFEHFVNGPSKETKDWPSPGRGKVLRTEGWLYVDADEMVMRKSEEVESLRDMVVALESIIKTIMFTNSSIKNAIHWERFMAGENAND